MRTPGFTLIECMVTLALASVLMLATIPAAREWQARHQVRAGADRLVTSLSAARNRAVLVQKPIHLCAGNPAAGCSGTNNWAPGWLVFQDRDGNSAWSPGETLQWVEAPAAELSIVGSRSTPLVRFLPDGSAPGSNVTLRVCHRLASVHGRRVVLANTGRIRVAEENGAAPAPCP